MISHLILVPGLMCDAEVWTHQSRELGSLTTVQIFDPGPRESLGAMAEAFLAAAPAHFALAGHSMGGRVAMEVMRRAADRVTHLALLDTNYLPRTPEEGGDREAENRYALLDIARTQGVRAMAARWVQGMVHPARLSDAELIESIISMMARKSAETFAAQIRALLHRPDATPVFSEVQCPTLVLCGRQDSWSVLARHEEMAALVPKSRLIVVEDCGHMSTMERSAEVAAAMRNWLTS